MPCSPAVERSGRPVRALKVALRGKNEYNKRYVNILGAFTFFQIIHVCQQFSAAAITLLSQPFAQAPAGAGQTRWRTKEDARVWRYLEQPLLHDAHLVLTRSPNLWIRDMDMVVHDVSLARARHAICHLLSRWQGYSLRARAACHLLSS